MALWLGVALAVSLAAVGALQIVRRCGDARVASDAAPVDQLSWRMSPLEMLPKPVWSTTRKIGMLTLRGYLVIAAGLMIVKVVELAIGGHM